MAHYLFIESRDPFESRDTRFVEETATALRQRGNEVTVFILQNGVFALRQNARNSNLARLVQSGVQILADDFSLLERGIATAELSPGVQPSNIETLVDALVQKDTKAIWH
jgi:intracellular sulfur oxidation DsrE/DsrF family protein